MLEKAGMIGILILLVVTLSYNYGYSKAETDLAEQQKEDIQESVARAIAQNTKLWEQDREILENTERVKTEYRTVTNTVVEEIYNTVYKCESLGDDWVRLHNDLIRASNTALSSIRREDDSGSDSNRSK